MGIAQEVSKLALANLARDKAKAEVARAEDALRVAKEAVDAAELAMKQEVARMVKAAEEQAR